MAIQINKKLTVSATILVSIVGLYALLGFLILPWYVKDALPAYVEEELQRQLVIEKIQFNPFNFKLNVNNIALNESNQVAIASLSGLFVDIDLNQLLDKTINIPTIRFNEPHIELINDKTGSLNLDRLIKSFSHDKDSENEESTLNIIFESIQIRQGSILVVDNAQETPVVSTVKDIDLSFSSISTIQKDEGDYQASLDLDKNTRVNINGRLTLFPLMSVGQFEINDLSAESINRWVKDSLPVEILRSDATIKGHYNVFSDAKGDVLFSIDETDIKINDISLKDKQSEVSISLNELDLNDLAYSSDSQTVEAKSISLSALGVQTEEQELTDIAKLSLSDIQYNIETARLKLAAIGLSDLDLILRKDAVPHYHLGQIKINEITFDNKANKLVIGKVELIESKLTVNTDSTGRFIPHKINIRSKIKAKREQSKLYIELRELHIANSSLDLISPDNKTVPDTLLMLDNMELMSSEFDLSQNRFKMGTLELLGAKLGLAINKDGVLNIQQLFSTDETAEAISQTEEQTAKKISLDKLLTKGIDIVLTDNSNETGIDHHLSNIDLEMQDFSNAEKSRSELSMNAVLNDNGQVILAGWVEPETAKVNLDLTLGNIALAYLSPYVEHDTNVSVESGELTFKGIISNSASEAGWLIDQAEAELDNFLLNDQRNGLPLIAFTKLRVEDIGVTTSPLAVRIDKLKLSKPYINVHIDEQQNLNLVSAFINKENVSDNTVSQETNTKSISSFALEIIELEQGNMDFADLNMKPKFSVSIDELNGVATGLNSAPERYTSLNLDGRVNEFGSVAITGELQPYDYRKQSEINLQFRNISTNSLSQYAAKYAGRQIKSGSLSLTLDYKLANNKLNGSNNIILESLVLGEKVSSPDAMDLPLDMALSLLQDSDGKIDINVPLKGDLEHPGFEIKSVIQKAIGNLLGGIVTAPFKFIGSLFDIDGEELKLINFKPGQSKIMPPEAEKLAALGKALLERPALILVISGAYDAKSDSLALGRKAVLNDISKATEDETFTLNYSEPKIRDAIDELAEQRIDKEVMIKLKEKTAIEPEADESSARTTYYKELFTRLAAMAATTIDKSALELLARDRVNSITDYIKQIDLSLAERIKFADEFSVVKSEKELVSVTLEIDAVK